MLQDAIAHHRADRLTEAELLYRKARAAAPKQFDVLHLSGLVAYQQGRNADAIALLTRAHQIDRKSAVCAMRLGLAHLAAHHAVEAEKFLREAVRLQPDFPEGWDNLAYCLKTQDRLVEAIACHERVTTAKPDYALGWYNYGLTLSFCGRSADALRCHERALALDPGCALARYGRAQALHQGNRIAEAVEDYAKFLAVQPGHHEARSYRLFALQNLDGLTREQLFAEHVAFGRAVGTAPAPEWPNPPEPERRLRVAILSPDLRQHSCAYFLEPLLQHLDREAFELYLYHDHFREDAVSQRFRGLAAVWRNFVGQTAEAVERAIRADAPDLLIDLSGHTGMTNRLPLFAHRLAPVQITYLGYPDTTGMPAMDYRLTDDIADPAGGADRFATEKLVRFAPTAWTYAPPENTPLPARAAGAPITFGCFNNFGKVSATTLQLWARVLAAVPESRLLLKGQGLGDATIARWLLERCAAAGLDISRIELIERTPDNASHLALYARVDVALDTFPYHGTTTTCEALWMGVPVVSLAGDRHAARVGASLLTAAGHPEWIARDGDDYVRIAAELAADPPRRAALRTGLRDDLRRGPLLDHAGQSARFATTLRRCWISWCEAQALNFCVAGPKG